MRSLRIGFFVLTLLALVSPCHAKFSEVFCVTGDSLNDVALEVDSMADGKEKADLTVGYMSGDEDHFTAVFDKGAYEKMLEGGQVVLVFETPKSNPFGGSLSNALLFVLTRMGNDTDFKGYLAFHGTVYELKCSSDPAKKFGGAQSPK